MNQNVLHLSTTGISESLKPKYWAEQYEQIWDNVDIIPTPGRSFDGEVLSQSCGSLYFNELLFKGHGIRRTTSHLRRMNSHSYALAFPQSGKFDLHIVGKKYSLVPGRAYLLASSESFECVDVAGYKTMNVIIPSGLIDERISSPQPFYEIDMEDAGLRVHLLYNMLTTCRDHSLFTGEEGGFITKQLLDLVEFCFFENSIDAASEEQSILRSHHRRACTYIEQNIDQETCNPESIARACGVSKSYLYRIFHVTGIGVMEYVREARLKRSYTMLCSSMLNRLSISEIAYRNGFNSLSSFSRAFNSCFGMSPSKVRTENSK